MPTIAFFPQVTNFQTCLTGSSHFSQDCLDFTHKNVELGSAKHGAVHIPTKLRHNSYPHKTFPVECGTHTTLRERLEYSNPASPSLQTCDGILRNFQQLILLGNLWASIHVYFTAIPLKKKP
ncbi:hypothetical protein TNCV_1377371 [Trichonephila clavipes]|nr:hypothetical protein TNCV_1377371 [Trichonephila clavipes]